MPTKVDDDDDNDGDDDNDRSENCTTKVDYVRNVTTALDEGDTRGEDNVHVPQDNGGARSDDDNSGETQSELRGYSLHSTRQKQRKARSDEQHKVQAHSTDKVKTSR